MRSLIEEFEAAVKRWSRRTGRDGYDVVFFGMTSTGGARHYSPIGAVDPSSVPPERRKNMKVGEIMGRYTLDQLVDRLSVLVEQNHISAGLLVAGVVADIDAKFDDLAENYSRGLSRQRAAAELIRKDMEDPEFQKRFNEELAEDGIEPVGYAEMLAMVQMMDKSAMYSIEEQRERVSMRDAWREETAGLVSQERLHAAWGEDIEAWGQEFGSPPASG